MNSTEFAEALLNSLSFASILILTALGLSITFGVMRVINMAHGEMLMLGAYTAYLVEEPQAIPVLLRTLGTLLGMDWRTDFGLRLSLFVAIPLAFVGVAFVGYIMEVGLIRFLYGRPLDTLLATWGVSLILQQAVLLTFGANLRDTHLPSEMQGYVEIGDLNLPKYRLFIVGITAVCLLSVYWWFFKT